MRIYLIGEDRHYVKWVTEECMIQMAKNYYETLLKINEDCSLGSEQEDKNWSDRYLTPEPIDKDSAYEYLSKNNLVKDMSWVHSDISTTGWINKEEIND